jgi:hypothetical protein
VCYRLGIEPKYNVIPAGAFSKPGSLEAYIASQNIHRREGARLSQTRPQEISLFAEGFGKKRHIDGRGKRIPLRGPAIEQKRPHRAGFRALKPHQNPMLPFCKGHRVSDPFRLFFPARL